MNMLIEPCVGNQSVMDVDDACVEMFLNQHV